MKFVINGVLLALAFLGGMALERHALPPSERHRQVLDSEANMVGNEKPTFIPKSRSTKVAKSQEDQSQPRDFAAAIREAAGTNVSLREKRELYEQWIDEDPAKALAYALSSENHQQLKHEVIHNAFGRMADEDLDLAMSAFASLETRRQRMEAAEGMAHHVNLAKRFILADFFSKEMPHAPIEAFYRRWAETLPAETKLLEYAEANGREALRAVAEGWAVGDPTNALSRASRLDKRLGTHTMETVLGVMASFDPSAATSRFHQLEPGPRRNEIAREIAHHLAQNDLHAARAWTESLDASAQRGALEELTHEWARQDPHSAGEFALSLADAEGRREAISEVAHRLAQSDPGAALDWVNQLEGENALSAMRGLVNTVAESDPNAAAELIAQLGPSEAYNEMAGDLAAHWSEFNPQAAAEWTLSLPAESEAQHHATERVADHWVEQDVSAAADWIGSMPQGEIRDVAAGRLVEHLAPNDPAAAFQWALTLNDLGHQTEVLHEVMEQWQGIDPEAAESTLNSAALSNEQREELGERFREPN